MIATTAPTATPIAGGERIESLDVLRGFALLGILLLNIIGFGLHSSAYSNPAMGIANSTDMVVWAGIELLAEGAMRCLFSILFGAGVVLFTEAKPADLHFKRNFWLLGFGLFDAYILLWSGDILINYALAGTLLYWVRDVSAKRLMVAAGAFIVLMSALHGATQMGLAAAKEAAAMVEKSDAPGTIDANVIDAAQQWHDFSAGYLPAEEQKNEELAARRSSYMSAFYWNRIKTNEMLLFVMPVFLFWDALAMMLLGMALYKSGILAGQWSTGFYLKLMLSGFAVGLIVNAFEVQGAVASDFSVLSTFPQVQVTYHVGRLGMALGYIGLLVLIVQKGLMHGERLAAVGRMALTNYLMHSVICLFLFTGAGCALVGEFSRWQLYFVVLAIWVVQLGISPWWLRRFRFGPLEWLWRGLTYGRWPENRIA